MPKKETYNEFVRREDVDEKQIVFLEKGNLIMRWVYNSPYDLFWRVELVSKKTGILHTFYGITDYEDAFRAAEAFSEKLIQNKREEE